MSIKKTTIEIEPEDNQDLSRRALLAGSVALTGAASLAPVAHAGNYGDRELTPNLRGRYFPRRRFHPDISLFGKLAVITGASRGIGKALAEALVAEGMDVIGTSRNPEAVTNPPHHVTLIQLDLTDPNSVATFPARLASQPKFFLRGRLDLLVNNAGRYTIGRIIPPTPEVFPAWAAARQEGVTTVYFGHKLITTALLPFMSQTNYARIIFNASIASYLEGWSNAQGSGFDTYTESKTALRIYANNLGTVLRENGSSIRVSTVNPYFVNTALADGANPIYTQPVDGNFNFIDDPEANAGLAALRAAQANGLSPEFVAQAFVQLAQMENPRRNVLAASRRQDLALQGGNAQIEEGLLFENRRGAIRFQS